VKDFPSNWTNVVKGVSGDGSGVLFPFAEMLLLISISVWKQVATNRMARFRRVFIRVVLATVDHLWHFNTIRPVPRTRASKQIHRIPNAVRLFEFVGKVGLFSLRVLATSELVGRCKLYFRCTFGSTDMPGRSWFRSAGLA
jgi:hypothetical protein